MLRFYQVEAGPFEPVGKFKYILCYGSTCGRNWCANPREIFKYILCYGSTPDVARNVVVKITFKYILCYGSTNAVVIYPFDVAYLNTSYVTVLRGKITIQMLR